ncbi:hypothetical protein D9758_007000 [Tetrapyrgos nigripes]|uniref:RING-type domain-containing protein n=1 Tax=Tetrapyrgos nigripes TaxID=182062 RepID=A0A8H5GSY1_9AGAR|nr:hypothetical protein D9758_007000 [Tetrapyrgos nigripes]
MPHALLAAPQINLLISIVIFLLRSFPLSSHPSLGNTSPHRIRAPLNPTSTPLISITPAQRKPPTSPSCALRLFFSPDRKPWSIFSLVASNTDTNDVICVPTRRGSVFPPTRLPCTMTHSQTSSATIALPDEECDIDLGAENPNSVLKEQIAQSSVATPDEDPEHSKEWKTSGIAVHTAIPPRPRDWHSNSYEERLKEEQERHRKEQQPKGKGRSGDERECGICFDPALNPRRTPCCKTLYCLEHITDWLTGPSAAGLCPSCETSCTIENGQVVLSSSSNSKPTSVVSSSNSTNPSTPTSQLAEATKTTMTLSPLSASVTAAVASLVSPTSPSESQSHTSPTTSRKSPASMGTYVETVHHPMTETLVDTGGIRLRDE